MKVELITDKPIQVALPRALTRGQWEALGRVLATLSTDGYDIPEPVHNIEGQLRVVVDALLEKEGLTAGHWFVLIHPVVPDRCLRLPFTTWRIHLRLIETQTPDVAHTPTLAEKT